MTENEKIKNWSDKKVFGFFTKTYPNNDVKSLNYILKYNIHNQQHRKNLMFMIMKHYIVDKDCIDYYIHIFSKYLSFSQKLQLINLSKGHSSFYKLKSWFISVETNITKKEILEHCIFDNF